MVLLFFFQKFKPIGNFLIETSVFIAEKGYFYLKLQDFKNN